MSKHHSIVVFSDIRGFTSASEKTAFHDSAQKFINDFQELRDKHFKRASVTKMTGDGFMLVYDIMPADRAEVLCGILSSAEAFINEFNALVRDLSDNIAVNIEFALGWGVSRGDTYETGENDRFGGAVNLAARLCDYARPRGFVISAENFREPPGYKPNGDWHSAKRHISGHHAPHRVWESDAPHYEFQARELRKESPEVHVAGVCVRRDNGAVKVLLMRRSEKRRLYKGLWEGCGGQLRYSESFSDGVARHFLTELGVAVNPVEAFNLLYHIREPNEPVIPGVRMLCEYIYGDPRVEPNYSEFRWVTVDELHAMDAKEFIPGLKVQMLILVDEYQGTSQQH